MEHVDSTIEDIRSYGTETQPRTYYVAREGLSLYSGPSFSHHCMAKLPLNEKVTRYRLKDGFAYVTVSSTGQKGWVNNGYLNWKTVPLPAEKVPEDVPKDVKSVPEAAATVHPSEEAAPVSSQVKPPNPSVEATIQNPSTNTGDICPDETPEPGDASSFDAF